MSDITQRLGDDPFLRELENSRNARKQRHYYIVNLLVSKRDGSRVLGPLTEEELKLKLCTYLTIMHNLGTSPEEAMRRSFLVYQFDGEFVRTNRIYLDVTQPESEQVLLRS